jgi:lysophospholipase L1-like esterase
MQKFRILIGILILVFGSAQGQQPFPYWNDVQQVILADLSDPKPRHQILFVGSSSFTMWKTANETFPEKTIVNVGFGGSTLLDQIRYIDYVITPYKPRQVVIYCGENDIAYDSTVTGREVLNRFIKLTGLIRERFPEAHLSYVSMKPSPSREKLLLVYREGNALIKEYLKSIKRSSYINVFDAMLDSAGNPRRELFLGDMLHMNEAGYAIWKELIRPHLK